VVVYHEDFARYGFTILRDRLAPAYAELKKRGYLERPGVRILEPMPVGERWVERVHTADHIRGVIHSGYYEVALLSAGAVVQGAELVALEKAASAFCFVGAAGHHASRDGFWGFCYLNDVAIAVEYLRQTHGMRRFAIIDIDPHYGDGTRDILGPDPQVMHVNFHAGLSDRTHEGMNNYDFGLPYDAGDEQFLSWVDRAIQLVSGFEHDLLFIIFGHDNHKDDYGSFELTEEFYPEFARRIRAAFPKKVCYVLSGGSNPRVARVAIGSVVDVLSSPLIA
jgi:acetoin utilization deacetylase AcuC-like enzyme